MSKAHLTNLVALLCLLLGIALDEAHLIAIGSYALSGAVTNHIAIHMLFERVPGFYGSGVIQLQFEAFKLAIKNLMMEQFFTRDHISRFMAEEGNKQIDAISMHDFVDKLDVGLIFSSLVDAIMRSELGVMLNMIGGEKLLKSFEPKFETALKQTLSSPAIESDVKKILLEKWHNHAGIDENAIERMIDLRLAELTPKMVKSMVQDIMQRHLGWLVVWGGVLGGAIGFVMSLMA